MAGAIRIAFMTFFSRCKNVGKLAAGQNQNSGFVELFFFQFCN
jgi:hypothetical protein